MLFRFFFKKIKIRCSRKETGGPFLRFLREDLWSVEEYRATPFSVRLVGLLDYLDLDLKKTEAKKANTIEAAIPPAVAVSPPFKTPSSPSFLTASRTPSAKECPKPSNGTEAPAPANSFKGPYTPIAERKTPRTTHPTRILAGVSLVLSIKI